MADISAWSPVDESNTAAPPAGAPEGMAHSAVNNTMRAMMGAVRRFYDWTTTNIVALQTSMAGYMPISGGSFTGPIGVVGNITATNVIASSGISATEMLVNHDLTVSNALTVGSVHVNGDLGATNMSTTASFSAGTWINAPQYRLAGVPIDFGAMFAELSDLQERVRTLEERL